MKRFKFKMVVSAFLISVSSTSFAEQSCLGEADPIGCWLQCTFAGNPPCPYDNSVVSSTTASVSLPSPSSEKYKKAVDTLEKQINSITAKSLKEAKPSEKNKLKGHLKQICSKSKLLAVAEKLKDANKVKDSCFKEEEGK